MAMENDSGSSEAHPRRRADALRLLFSHFLKMPWAVDKSQGPLWECFPEIDRKFLAAMRIPDYATNTEKSYLAWINRFLRFHHDRYPCELAEPEVASLSRVLYLEYLDIKRKVSQYRPTSAKQ